ncbi:MAG: methyltransferase domain-containing protein [Burkholderiales bacterium]|nr:methyltransferase domain-containing protein [Burkholderiales bacterium]
MTDNITISTPLIRKVLNRKSSELMALDFIFKELATRVISRLDYIKLTPHRILDCGSGLGFDRELLAQKYPESLLIELDCALEILRPQLAPKSKWSLWRKAESRQFVCGDAYHLPLASASIDFFYSNLLLPYISDIPAFVCEMRRVMALGGAFCFAGLGVDSLKELRALGFSSYRFPDMHDIGDMLVDAGFSNPVVDTEYITLNYDDLQTLLQDIRLLGCGAANDSSLRRNLTTRQFSELAAGFKNKSKLTLEVFVAHGWKDRNKIELPAGQNVINFQRN